MTEAEWNTCTNLEKLSQFLRGKASDRKLRLFAVASCRQFRDLGEDGRFIQAVDDAERYADGLTTKASLKRARQGVRAARYALRTGLPEQEAKWVALWLAEVTASENAVGGFTMEIDRLATQGLLVADKPSDLIHDLLGNPFRPATIDSGWLNSTVAQLAEAIYQERAFDRLPILADALEEAGCTNADILNHCRQPGEHVRGCWVIDLLTGRK